MLNRIDARDFLQTVMPAIKSGDVADLAQRVLARWQPCQLCSLLKDPLVDVRRVAAVTLGFVGDKSIVPCLSEALRDADEMVNQMAEHGLWSIWFRSGDVHATKPFREGVALLSAESYAAAAECFRQATQIDPQFAEAYNQCALAHFFIGQWHEAIDDSRQAIELIPTHFGAIAGMGHCYTQLGDLRRALSCYRQALSINPRMPAIASAIHRLESTIARRSNDESGQFLVDQILG